MVNNGYVYLKIEKRRKTGKELSHAQAPGAQRQSPLKSGPFSPTKNSTIYDGVRFWWGS